ncbi:hypothetical protein SISNIDRAFT_455891 [Sistotremastrum niveocremeum HHB9708]|uniref:Uncharacterized protein n=1 Tax=Sistotremastrum niveocremeum HHB9708 TaxID=1314777 RepID=A0A164T799_9AGAM|nr:hypothetical protein SISNIDRAFT_455891 [Sistotremastrum niveocremeum HHB9708]
MGATEEELRLLIRRLIVPGCDEQLSSYLGLEGAKKATIKMHDAHQRIQSQISLVLQEAACKINAQLPISVLPPEILSRIFEYHGIYLRTRKQESISYDKWFDILRVCWYWRKTALRTPGFWSYIEAIWPPQIRDIFVRRSGEVPLQVNLLFDDERPYDALWYPTISADELKILISRAHDLSMYEDLNNLNQTLRLSLSPQHLRTLTVTRRMGARGNENSVAQGLSEYPNVLQELTISHTELLQPFTFSCVGLRKLCLSAGEHNFPRSRWEGFLQAASQFTRLQDLQLIDVGMPTDVASRTFELTQLEIFTFTDKGWYPRNINFSGLRLPSLITLSIETPVHDRQMGHLDNLSRVIASLPFLDHEFRWLHINPWIFFNIELAPHKSRRLQNIRIASLDDPTFLYWIGLFCDELHRLVPLIVRGIKGLSLDVELECNLEGFLPRFAPLTPISSNPLHSQESLEIGDIITLLNPQHTTEPSFKFLHIYFREFMADGDGVLEPIDGNILALYGRSPWLPDT